MTCKIFVQFRVCSWLIKLTVRVPVCLFQSLIKSQIANLLLVNNLEFELYEHQLFYLALSILKLPDFQPKYQRYNRQQFCRENLLLSEIVVLPQYRFLPTKLSKHSHKPFQENQIPTLFALESPNQQFYKTNLCKEFSLPLIFCHEQTRNIFCHEQTRKITKYKYKGF